MVDIQRILCPIDFSDSSRHALAHAVTIAKWYGAEITALHVIHPAFLVEPPVLFADFQKNDMSTASERRLREEELRVWLAPAEAAGVKAGLRVEEGNPAVGILECAASLPADLTVMGTHGRSGFARFVLGSVAEKVLRKALCPVLTVPMVAETRAMLPYKRLLCPVDFSEASLAALRFAFSIAKESDAHVTILHVFEWPQDETLLVGQFDTPKFRRVVEEQTRSQLEKLVTEDVRTWCEPETKIAYGKPYQQTLETAKSDATDLIVIGVRGRSTLDLGLFGSTTNHVVRRAPCPVLTLQG